MSAYWPIMVEAYVLAVLFVVRFCTVGQPTYDATDDLADSERAVLFAEFRNFHAAPNNQKEQPDHGA